MSMVYEVEGVDRLKVSSILAVEREEKKRVLLGGYRERTGILAEWVGDT